MLGPLDIAKINAENPVVEELTHTEDGGISATSQEGQNYLKTKINEILGAEHEVSKVDTELTKILEWAEGKGAKTLEDVLWEVRELANHLGTPSYGESRLKFLYQYVYLLNESREITNKLKKMEGFNA